MVKNEIPQEVLEEKLEAKPIVSAEVPVAVSKDDEVEFMEEAEDLDEGELNSEMEGLIVLANDFYDREMERYEKE